jgi:hypothetical protein
MLVRVKGMVVYLCARNEGNKIVLFHVIVGEALSALRGSF